MLKLTDPTLKREEILRILDYDEALQVFFKVRGLPENVQEAFTVIADQWTYDKFSCIVVALRLLDEENLEGELPRYLEEKPLHIQARFILLNYPTKRHLGKLRRAVVVLRLASLWADFMKKVGAVKIGPGFPKVFFEIFKDAAIADMMNVNQFLETLGLRLGLDGVNIFNPDLDSIGFASYKRGTASAEDRAQEVSRYLGDLRTSTKTVIEDMH
jgi:hypothetical protein